MSVRILRAFFIRKILDTRFGQSALQEFPEAMSERERLEGATEGELEAELTALALWSGEAPAGAVPSGPADRDDDHMPMAPMPGLPSS